MTREALRRWIGLTLGLVVMAAAVLALNRGSRSAGDVMARSQLQGLESDAYFYTETGDVGAFLEEGGRYRREGTRQER